MEVFISFIERAVLGACMEDKNLRKNFSEYYNQRNLASCCRWIDKKKKKFLQHILATAPTSSLILEIGPGAGTILSAFTEKFHIVGLEINPVLLKKCQKKGFLCIQGNGDFCLPFKNESVHILIAIDAIEHIQYRHNFLKEAYRVLKKEGRIIIFTPPYDSMVWILAEKIHNWVLQTHSDHVSPFTQESMYMLLSTYFSNVNIIKTNFSLTMIGVGEK